MTRRSSKSLFRLLRLNREDGQDLVEYALVVALIAFGTAAGMKQIASGISSVFTAVANTVSTSVS